MSEAIIKHEGGASSLAQIPDATNLQSLAQNLLASGLFPAVKNIAGAVTIIEYGRELGIPPVASLQTMAVVQGRLCMESKAMLALFQNHGGRIKIIERSTKRAAIELSKNGNEPYVHAYTWEQAKAEGLTGKSNWQKMPETMLYWRAIATGIRAYDPGAIYGLYSKEEMLDLDKQGKPVAVQSQSQPPESPVGDTVDAEIVPENAPGEASSGEKGHSTDIRPPKDDVERDFLLDEAEKDAIIDGIRGTLNVMGVDEKDFKEWLFDYQAKVKHRWVGKIGKSIRFHLGELDELKKLQGWIIKALEAYKKDRGTTDEKA